MANSFHLKIISPAAVVVDAYVAVTEIPGIDGDFGVLPGHAAFFSMIRPGVIHVQYPDGVRRRFFAASGYADVTPEGCTLLSDHIQDLADISASEAQEAVIAARQALSGADDAPTRARAVALLQSAEALVAAIAA